METIDYKARAEKAYFSVQEEWVNVRRMFGDVLNQLRAIE